MNSYKLKFLFAVALIFPHIQTFAQADVRTVSMQNLNELKKQGKLNGTEKYTNYQAPVHNTRIANPVPQTQSSLCNCWIERDGGWQIGEFDYQGANGGPGVAPEYRNDDWSTNTITLPFNFCFYGQTINSVYLNNNGNISIGATYSTFTANSFPSGNFVMIAPFWADVDTRGLGSGLVYYKVTPTYAIFQWENVGYFNAYDDKLNSFQLIITDGNDTIIPPGDNVSFCYKDMEWTTGDASGGINGFGGTPATVGINQGNGVDYIQVGLYDQAGAAWDGPYGNNDGIDALDNQSYFFNCCFSNSNIPPILRSTTVCDTLHLCVGDTVVIDADYLSPEPAQLTTASVNTNGTSGVNILQQTTGNMAHIQIQFIADASNVGFNTIYLIGTDNGNPAQTSSTPIVISVQPAPTAAATFFPPSPITPGTTVNFTNTSTGLFNNWDFGDTTTSTTLNPSHTYNYPGTYYVTLVNMNPNGCADTLIMQIDVSSCVTVNVLAATTACAGDPVTFTYQGNASGAAVYNWNFGTGNILTGTNGGPYEVVWNTPGTYNVTLDVTDNGCTSTPVTTQVTVNANPIASFTSTPVICEGDTIPITFNGTSIPGATYNWYFQNGTVVSGSGVGPVNVSWTATGNDSIGLIVSQFGCTDTTGSFILVNPTPTSDFTVPASVCEASTLPVSYTGSASAGANYSWNFGTGVVTSGTGQGPYVITWPVAGPTSITLTVTENGCVSPPTTIPVMVNDIPVAAINATPVLCVGDVNVITYSGAAGGGATYVWNFGSATVISGSGAGPYSVSWPNAMNDSITVTVDENGCMDSTSFQITVNPIPNSPFNLPSSVCAGNDVTISYTGSASSLAIYNWNFGGGNIISGSGQGPYVINWNTAGNANVSLTVTENGCTSPVTNNPITVTAAPITSFTASTVLCAGDQNNIIFTGSASGTAVWNWNFGNASVISGTGNGPYVLEYPVAGNYTISLIISDNGCSDTATTAVLVNPIPTSTFTLPPSVCDNVPVNIIYTGTASGNATYNWNFGSGTVLSGTGMGPYSVAWNNSGNQSVTLTVSENGCSSPQSSNTIVVNAHPVATLSAAPVVCTGDDNLVTFTGIASVNANYNWDFGNATVISGSNEGPYLLEWTSAGNQNITLIVTENGCSDSSAFDILVNAMPASAFMMQPSVCVGDPVTVTFTGAAGVNAVYNWDFGNAAIQSGTGQGPYSLIWNSPGNQSVTLIVSENGCVAPLSTDSIYVAAYPAANAGLDAVECSGAMISIGSNPEAGVTYQWSPVMNVVDSAASSTSILANNQSLSPISTTYTLTASNATGCVSTDQVVITVNPIPVVSFTAPPAQCLNGNNFSFNAAGNMIGGTQYSWSFGSNASPSISNAQNPSQIIFSAAGHYPITINAVLNNCPAIPYTDSIVVHPSPVANFTPLVLEGCEPLEVPLLNNSTGDLNSYSWYFSDSRGSIEEAPSHIFENAGTYSISLHATTQHGCTHDTTQTNIIHVYPVPVASFTPQPEVTTILEPLIQFSNLSVLGDYYNWDFGDQSFSILFSPTHQYTDTGTFEILLVVSTTHGCLDTIKSIVRVEGGFTFYIPNAFTPDGNGANDFFQGYGVSIKNYELQIFDRWGLNIFSTDSYEHPWDGTVNGNPAQSDVYVYKIKLTDNFDLKHEYIGKVTLVR